MNILIGFLRGMAAIGIATGAGMYGYSCLKEVREKKSGYEDMIQLLDLLEEQVIYRKSTLPEAFQKVKKYNGQKNTYEQSKKAIEDCYSSLFGEEETQHVEAVTNCFDAQNAERTKELLHREKLYFQGKLKEHEDKYKDQEKAVISVCLLMGLFLCIALW